MLDEDLLEYALVVANHVEQPIGEHPYDKLNPSKHLDLLLV